MSDNDIGRHVANQRNEAMAERDDLRAQLAQRDTVIRDIRELHAPVKGEWNCGDPECVVCESGEHEGDICGHCFGFDNEVYPYPCPTVRILDRSAS